MTLELLAVFDKPLRFLRICGIWLDKDVRKVQIFFYVIMHLVFAELFCVLEIMHMTNVESVADIAEGLIGIGLIFQSSIKTLYFIYNKDKLEKLMITLESLIQNVSWKWQKSDGKLKRRVAQANKVFKAYLALALSGYFAGYLKPFANHELAFKLWLPFDIQSNEILFWLTVVYEGIEGIFFTPLVIIIDSYPIFFLGFAIGLIEELSDLMEDLNCDQHVETSREGYNDLVHYIELQLDIKKFVVEIQDIFAMILFIQAFISTSNLCTTSFSLTIVS